MVPGSARSGGSLVSQAVASSSRPLNTTDPTRAGCRHTLPCNNGADAARLDRSPPRSPATAARTGATTRRLAMAATSRPLPSRPMTPAMATAVIGRSSTGVRVGRNTGTQIEIANGTSHAARHSDDAPSQLAGLHVRPNRRTIRQREPQDDTAEQRSGSGAPQQQVGIGEVGRLGRRHPTGRLRCKRRAEHRPPEREIDAHPNSGAGNGGLASRPSGCRQRRYRARGECEHVGGMRQQPENMCPGSAEWHGVGAAGPPTTRTPAPATVPWRVRQTGTRSRRAAPSLRAEGPSSGRSPEAAQPACRPVPRPQHVPARPVTTTPAPPRADR